MEGPVSELYDTPLFAPLAGARFTDPQQVLESVFGYREFRPGQRRIIDAVLAGRDCIGVMPTGAGKSLTFQIPAKILPGPVLGTAPLIPVLALTATATRRVAGDIIRQLGMRKPDGFKGSFFRPNLHITVQRKGGEGAARRETRRDILGIIRRHRGESGIVYCMSRRAVDSLTGWLAERGVRAAPYHAGLSDEERTRNQDAFARDEVDVVVATVAFGMGIDKSNVRYVIHREMPRSIEGYYQEIGRAGRDGLASDCILLYSWADVLAHRRLQETIEDAELRREAGRKSIAIYELAEAPGCRHQSLVARFDETIPACGTACDSCRGTSFVDLVRPVKSAPVDRPAPSHDGELFQRLRALRRALADAEGVPAYLALSGRG